MLYTCAGNMQNAFVRKFRCTFVVEPLNHIHQDTKSAGLIAVCERSFILRFPFIASSPTFYFSIFISTLPTQHTTFMTGKSFGEQNYPVSHYSMIRRRKEAFIFTLNMQAELHVVPKSPIRFE